MLRCIREGMRCLVVFVASPAAQNRQEMGIQSPLSGRRLKVALFIHCCSWSKNSYYGTVLHHDDVGDFPGPI